MVGESSIRWGRKWCEDGGDPVELVCHCQDSVPTYTAFSLVTMDNKSLILSKPSHRCVPSLRHYQFSLSARACEHVSIFWFFRISPLTPDPLSIPDLCPENVMDWNSHYPQASWLLVKFSHGDRVAGFNNKNNNTAHPIRIDNKE